MSTTLKDIADSKVTVFIKPKENIFQSMFKDLVSFAVIAFCVYISQGSTWWTFITGAMFLFFSFIKIGNLINKSATTFDNKEDAIEYINSHDIHNTNSKRHK